MTRFLQPLALTLTLLALAGSAQAQVLIDQNRVLAGNVTPGDTPGFPLTLSQPGHYRLTSGLNVPAGSVGVVITAPDVTLDLNGFAIVGPNKCSQMPNFAVMCSVAENLLVPGIHQNDMKATSATIRNGSVRGFAGPAIFGNGSLTLEKLYLAHSAYGYAGDGFAQAGFLGENLHVELNLNAGITVFYGVLSKVRVASNGSGIYGSSALLVQDSLVRYNNGVGVEGGAVRGTVSTSNKGANFSGSRSMGGNLNSTSPF